MSIDRAKLSVYLDELDDDPIRACEMAKQIGVVNISLRRVWATNIGRATDAACQQIMTALQRHGLGVLAVCVDDGRDQVDRLVYDQAIKRSILVANYFKAKLFRPFAGSRRPVAQQADSQLAAWLTAIGAECERSTMVPVLEIDPDAYVFEPADVAALLNQHKNWRLLYDPALLVIKRNQDPLLRYWRLLHKRVAAVDLHDYKIGSGFVPIGAGDCKVEDVIRDCVVNQYNGWFIIEPGALRRTGPQVDRVEIARAVIANYILMAARGREAMASWRQTKPTDKQEKGDGKKRS